MPRITGEHPWIDSVLQRKQHKLVITCFRLPFSTQANLRAAAAKHDVDQIRIVRPVLREYAEVVLSAAQGQESASDRRPQAMKQGPDFILVRAFAIYPSQWPLLPEP